MKVAIYSPYLDTLGGGEKYISTIAEFFSLNNEVHLLLDKNLEELGGDDLRLNLEKRFNLNLEKVKVVPAPLGKDSNFISRYLFLNKYDLLFYLTDGSIFFPSSRKNILHIQSPLVGQPAKSIWGKFKLKAWDIIIYNSEFTKTFSEKNWPINSYVIHPPVDVGKIKPLKKKKNILSVGRFSSYLRDKKHKELIEAFKKLYDSKKVSDWSMDLVGSAAKGDMGYIDELRKIAAGFPVNFYPNLEYDELVDLYGQSSIYWHASGLDEDDPTKMEHFGIAIVEAMAAGCVPIIIGKGGHEEIVEDGQTGFLWNNLDELCDLTIKIIGDDDLRKKISNKVQIRAQSFSKEKFIEKLNKLQNIIS